VFVIKTGSGTLRLSTPKFENVRMITFDADVKGEITCGPRRVQSSVVVCYTAGTDKQLHTDGGIRSLEFVPRDFQLSPLNN